MEQSERIQLIHQAAKLPKGDPKRRDILAGLKKHATDYNGDPNVSLEALYYNANISFCEDVAHAIIRYSSLGTPLQSKPGGGYTRRDVAYWVLSDRDTGRSVAAEVMIRGKAILVAISDVDSNNEKKWKFPLHETPASIAATISWYGKELLTGETMP